MQPYQPACILLRESLFLTNIYQWNMHHWFNLHTDICKIQLLYLDSIVFIVLCCRVRNEISYKMEFTVFITYSFFDIFTLTYLGNELIVSSDRLSYCLFESNWMENVRLDKRSIFILGESLKQSREMIIGRIYPLNLKTFTKVNYAGGSVRD